MKLRILDKTGHTKQELQPKEAAEQIASADRNYWVFVDGVYTERATITANTIASAWEVVMTPELQAG